MFSLRLPMGCPGCAPTPEIQHAAGAYYDSGVWTCPVRTRDAPATIGIDIGKNMFHLIGFDKHGAIVMQARLSRSQLGRRLANIPCCLIGMEACAGAHHLGRMFEALGHDVRLIPAQYVNLSSKAIRMTIGMLRRLPKRCSGRPCGLFGSRRRRRWTCWLCTGFDRALSVSAPA